MADQVEEIKQKTDIVTLIGEYIDLKKAGRNFKANCPFHSEKTPSFNVSPELQIFKCFGCGMSGDVYSFLQEYEGMDFYESLKFLADKAGVELKSTNLKARSEKQKLYELNNAANKFYQYVLLNHPSGKNALSYLTKQRHLKMSTIKTFQLGFCPNVPFALKKFLVDKKKFKENDIEKAGIIYRGYGKVFDRFRGRVIFPLHDHRGNIVGFAGRAMPNAKKDIAKYINTPETPLYHKSKVLYGLNFTRKDIKKSSEVVVVEGELDMISSWQVGIKNTIALKGSAFTEDQARLLSRFAQRAILALDADLAGDEAAKRGIVIAEKAGLDVRVAQIVKYKDPDEMAHKDPKGLKKVLDKPIGVWDFLIDSVFAKHNKETGTGKAKISKNLMPILSTISDSIVQAHYIKQVARKLDVSEDAVIQQTVKTEIVKPKEKEEEIFASTTKITRRELLERRLMALVFSLNPKLLKKKKYHTLLDQPFTRKLYEHYLKYLKKNQAFKPSDFASCLPKELVEGYAEMILRDSKAESDNEDTINVIIEGIEPEKELEIVIKELEVIDVRDKLQVIANDIHKYEKSDEKIKLKKAQKKFSSLSSNLSKLEEKLRI